MNVYSSPLQRCKDSIKILSQHIDIEPVYLDQLTERNHGLCEGLTMDRVRKNFPDFYSEWQTKDKWFLKWPAGESYNDVFERGKTAAVLMNLTVNALIVAHEIINKILLGILLDLEQKDIISIKQANNEIFCVTPNDRHFEKITVFPEV